MNFPFLSTRGHLTSQNVELNEKVQSREDQPELLVINYLLGLYDKTQVSWFTLQTLNKSIMTESAECLQSVCRGWRRSSSSSAAVELTLFFFLFLMQQRGLISA